MSNRIMRSICAASCVLAASAAAAQQAPAEAPPAAPEAARTTVEEVIVTARRRSESLQEVPGAITVISGKAIADAHIEHVADFAMLMPNVSFDAALNLGQNFLTIRGVTQTVFKPPPAAIVIDGVQIISPLQFNIEQFDLEQIELLKGPQGGMYGRNAIAGALNITTRKPGAEPEATATLGYGSGNERQLRAAWSGPVLPQLLSVGGALSYTKRRGTMQNATTGQYLDHYRDLSGRLRALLTPAHGVLLDLRAASADTRGGDSAYVLNPSGDPDAVNGQVRANVAGSNPRKLHDYSAKLDVDGALAKFTLMLAYVDVRESLYSDLDFTELDMFRVQQKQRERGFSQEVRIAANRAQGVRWMAGAYHVRRNTDLGQMAFADPGLFADPPQPTNVADFQLFDNHDRGSLENYAVFGQLEYDIRPALELALALRHDRDTIEQLAAGETERRSARFNKLQPKLTLTSKANRDMVLYGSYGVGFRSGDFNPSAATFGPDITRAESADSIEFGAKTRLFDRRLTFNTAIFHTAMKDYQVQLQDLQSGSNVGINLDKVRIQGLEMEAAARLLPALTVNAALGITDAEIRRFALQPELVGKRPPRIAPYSANLGFTWDLPLGDALRGSVRSDYRRIGSWKWSVDNQTARRPADYLNLHASLRHPQAGWTLSASVRNALNERASGDYQTAAMSGIGTDAYFPAQGRTYQAELTFHF